MSKADEAYLKKCRQRITSAKNFRRQEGLDDTWDRMVDLYRGRQWMNNLPSDDRMVVNVAFATINVIAPSVAFSYPKVTVHARQPDLDTNAVLLEQVVNYWWQHYDVMPEFQLAVKDSLIVGFGWLKCGYRYVTEDVEDEEGYEAEFERMRGEADEYASANPLGPPAPTDDEIAESIPISSQTVIHEDRPFCERVGFKDVYVDPDGTTPRDIKWIAQKIMKTLEEVRGDDSYKKSTRNKLKADSRVSDWLIDAEGSTADRSPEDQLVTVWEYYDLQNGQMCVFSDFGDDFLVDPMEQPYVFGHPFTMIPNYTVPDHFYPMGELEALEPLQHELNLTRSAMFNDRKQYRRRWLYKPEAFDKSAREQLTSPLDNIAIAVSGSTPLNEAIMPMPSNEPNPQLYQDSQIIEKDLVDISGVNEYMRGSIPEIRRTATEAAIIQDAANSRAADKLSKVEWAVKQVARRMVQLAQQYMDTPQVARLVGADGMDYWFEFEPEDIQGEFDFEVEAGSTQPKNDIQRRKTAMELMQTLMPFADPALGLVNARAVLSYALKFGFDINNPDQFLTDPMEQMQQQMMQMGMGEEEGMEEEGGPEGGMAPPMGEGPSLEAQAGAPPMDMAQALAGQMGRGV